MKLGMFWSLLLYCIVRIGDIFATVWSGGSDRQPCEWTALWDCLD